MAKDVKEIGLDLIVIAAKLSERILDIEAERDYAIAERDHAIAERDEAEKDAKHSHAAAREMFVQNLRTLAKLIDSPSGPTAGVLRIALVDLERFVTKTGGFMQPEDQATLRRARFVIAVTA